MKDLPVAFHDEIMSEVEAILERKSDNLWRRGQAELAKLSVDRNQAMQTLQKLTARQDILLKEHMEMRSSLTNITEKLQAVATEMRDALRCLPRPQGLDVPGFDIAGEGLPALQHAAPGLTPCLTPAPGLSEPLPHEGLRTPPRALGRLGGSVPAGSPAVLSLASALPSGVMPAPPTKRLQIAECLELDRATAPGLEAFASPFSDNSGNADMVYGEAQLYGWTPPAQLRAEAPVFVPGAPGDALKPRRLI